MRVTKKIIFMIVIIFLGMCPIKAYYNGEGVNAGGGTLHQGCPSSAKYCAFNNDKHTTVRIGVWYYNPDHSYEIVGHPIYLSSNTSAISVLGVATDNIYSVPGLTYENVRNIVETNIKTYISWMGINPDNENRDSIEVVEGVHDLTRYGYRLFIEPVFTVYRTVTNGTTTTGEYSLRTTKQIAFVGSTCNGNFYGSACGDSTAKYWGVNLTTDLDDVGISHAAAKGTSLEGKINNLKNLTATSKGSITSDNVASVVANEWNGFGYNIIDATKYMKTCYKITVDSSRAAKCINTGKANIGIFEEVVEKIDCPAVPDETINKNGRLVEIGSCKFRCLEKVQQNYPGNYKPRVQIGTHFVWPTGSKLLPSRIPNFYSLSLVGTRTCLLESGDMRTCSNVDSSKLYPFKSSLSVKWQDGSTSSKGNLKTEKADLSKSPIKYKKIVDGNTITVKANVIYTLSDNFKRYVNKKDNSITSTRPSSNYIDIGYGNLPNSSESTKNKYDLIIEMNELGVDNVFGQAAKNAEYKCNYKITSDSESCICPENTKMAGMDIYEKVVVENITCPDAQQKYCDSPIPDPFDGVCVTCPDDTIRAGIELMCINGDCEKTKYERCNLTEPVTENEICGEVNDKRYCPEPYDTSISIFACLKAGGTYNRCVKTLCPNGTRYKCKNTNKVGGHMDITSCVQTKVAQGKSLQRAIDECDHVICPLGSGLNIIYRVIDLVNPFPSYDADNTVSQDGLSRGIFNKTVRGRYPGSNWNSKIVVSNKILRNRNVSSDDVYSKEPLYKFVLTSNTIKTIRNYNKNRNYNDFNLNCLNNNSTACKSNFVHNSIYGLKSGSCKSVTKDNFYKCVN